MVSKDKATAKDTKKENDASEGGALDPIKNAYFAVEDKYYAAMDWLEQKAKLPVYPMFVEPIETRGIPSFPFALLAMLLVIIGIVGAASMLMSPQTGDVTISLQSSKTGLPIDDATVTLFIDNEKFDSLTTHGGAVTFLKVPLGKVAAITAQADNYQTATRTFESLTPGNEPLVLKLEEVAKAAAITYKVSVVDATGGVFGAKVTPNFGGATGTAVLTNSNGLAEITLANTNAFTVSVEKTGYKKVTSFPLDPANMLFKTITIQKSEACEGDDCDATSSLTAKKVQMTVRARNAQGNPVVAEVTLTSETGKTIAKAKTIGGSAQVEVPQGSVFAYSAIPTDVDAGKYVQYASNGTLTAEKDREIEIILLQKPQANYDTITLQVVDEDGKKLTGATVAIYNEYNGAFTARNITRNGATAFEVPKANSYYATAYYDGYFPMRVHGLRAPASGDITLHKITAGSNGSVEVQVLAFDGSAPVEGATLTVQSSNGYYEGYPQAKTNADGKATIKSLAAGTAYQVVAEYGPRKGTSATFTPASDKPAKTTIRLQPTTATITVNTKDLSTGAAISATVIAYASGTGMENKSCATEAGNLYACTLTVYAETPVRVEATANGYERFYGLASTLEPDDSATVTASLMPSALKNEFLVRFNGVTDENGNNATMIDKGAKYTADFTVNIPNQSAGSSGIMVAVGRTGPEVQSALDATEHFVIKSDGTYADGADGIFRATYKPQASCSLDDSSSYNEQDAYKWVTFQFDNATGSRQVKVKMAAKPDAADGETMRIRYRGWVNAGNGIVVHKPADSAYGSNWRTNTLDWCYAATEYADRQVAYGKTACNNGACISVEIVNGTDVYPANSAQATVGMPAMLTATVRFTQTVQSPMINISVPDREFTIGAYGLDGSSANDGQGRISGFAINLPQGSAKSRINATLNPVSPAGRALIIASVYGGQRELARVNAYVSINGDGTMKLELVKPKGSETLMAGENGDVQLRLTDKSSGNPIRDATVSISDPAELFGDAVPESLTAGDDEGYYEFNGITPSSLGTFSIVASQESYATATKSVQVSSKELFHTEPQQELHGCGNSQTLYLYNDVDAELSMALSGSTDCISSADYLYSQEEYELGTTPAWTGGGAVYDSFSRTYTFKLPAKRVGMFTITPKSWGAKCTITVNANTANKKSKTIQSVDYSVCPETEADDFLSITPSEAINTKDGQAGIDDCNSPRKYTIAISSALEGATAATVMLQGNGLTYKEDGVALGTAYSLGSIAAGSSKDITIVPGKYAKLSLNVIATTSDNRRADVAVAFDNCKEQGNLDAPSIIATGPSGEQTGTSVTARVVTADDAICKIGVTQTAMTYSMKENTASTNGKEYDSTLTLAGTAEAPAMKEGANTYYAKCCNSDANGGKCSSVAQISFSYSTKSCKAAAEACTKSEECCSDLECTNSKCTIKGSTTTTGTGGTTIIGGDTSGTGGTDTTPDTPTNPETPTTPETPGQEPTAVDKTVTLKLSGDAAKFYDAAGTEITSVTLGVSSIIPTAGFVLKVQNDEENARTINLGSSACYAVLDAAGKPVAKIDMAKKATKYYIIAYPNPAKLDDQGVLKCEQYKYSDDAGIELDAKPATINFGINSKTVPFDIKPENAKTGSLTLGSAIMASGNMFARYSQESASELPQIAADSVGINYGSYVFNNIMLENTAAWATKVDGEAWTQGMQDPVGSYRVGFAGPLISLAPAANLQGTGNSSLAYGIAISVPLGNSEISIDQTKLAAPTVNTKRYADATPSGVLTHATMSAKLDKATAELRNFQSELDNLPAESGKSTEAGFVQKTLGLAQVHSKLPDIFATAVEGNSLRILLFEAQEGYKYAEPKDITGTYEYPEKAGYSAKFRGQIAGTYWPYTKMFAYPGQKNNTAYYCVPGTDCSNPKLDPYAEEQYTDWASGNNYKLLTLSAAGEECAPAVYQTTTEYCQTPIGDTDKFCNPATGRIEHNPSACCTETGASRNGKCVKANKAESCVLTASGIGEYFNSKYDVVTQDAAKIRQAWQAKPQSNGQYSTAGCTNAYCNKCFEGTACDAVKDDASSPDACAALDYAGTKANGYTAYAAINPGGRCFYYHVNGVMTSGESKTCMWCHSYAQYDAIGASDKKSTMFFSLYPEEARKDIVLGGSTYADTTESATQACTTLGKFNSAQGYGYDYFDGGNWVSDAPGNFLNGVMFGRRISPEFQQAYPTKTADEFKKAMVALGIASSEEDARYFTENYDAVETPATPAQTTQVV